MVEAFGAAVDQLLDGEQRDQRTGDRDGGVEDAMGVIDGMRKLPKPRRKLR
jgi:hypothetical protein